MLVLVVSQQPQRLRELHTTIQASGHCYCWALPAPTLERALTLLHNARPTLLVYAASAADGRAQPLHQALHSGVYYADVHYADVHYADVHYADVHYADVHYADVHYADVHYADVPLLLLGAVSPERHPGLVGDRCPHCASRLHCAQIYPALASEARVALRTHVLAAHGHGALSSSTREEGSAATAVRDSERPPDEVPHEPGTH